MEGCGEIGPEIFLMLSGCCTDGFGAGNYYLLYMRYLDMRLKNYADFIDSSNEISLKNEQDSRLRLRLDLKLHEFNKKI